MLSPSEAKIDIREGYRLPIASKENNDDGNSPVNGFKCRRDKTSLVTAKVPHKFKFFFPANYSPSDRNRGWRRCKLLWTTGQSMRCTYAYMLYFFMRNSMPRAVAIRWERVTSRVTVYVCTYRVYLVPKNAEEELEKVQERNKPTE